MIEFCKLGVRVSRAVLRALVAFGGTDPKRPEVAIGIDSGDLCATDGHSAIRFERLTKLEVSPMARNGLYWPVVHASHVAEMTPLNDAVLLAWEYAGSDFPAISKVEPERGFAKQCQPIGVDPELLARLVLAAKACRREREPGERVNEKIPLPGAVLVAHHGSLRPLMFAIGEASYWRAQHVALVTIMPQML